jgi:glycerol-3-phosphate acyltransferase PlsX
VPPIVVDAMGGDRAPEAILDGACAAADAGLNVALVGPAGLDTRGLELIEASEVISMDEDPTGGVRKKKDSTLVRAAEAVRDGRAIAMVSAGNTGATMASALLRMGRIRGVSRPAIATPIPVPGAAPNILLDAGANAEVQPEWLVQFAQMGSVYATHRFGVEAPTVGLLSIGEEPGKGDTLRKEAYELLAVAPNINFIGNVEGRDMMVKTADVVVTDGFTGNAVLKTLEGGMKVFIGALIEAFNADPANADHVGALMPALVPLYTQMAPETYGGAVLLGVDGLCIISHGSSNATAIHNAIKVAHELATNGFVDHLRAAVSGAPS